MSRTANSDKISYGWPDREWDGRAANIAAMGHRLAAAGPRTRQRLRDRRADTDTQLDAPADNWDAGTYDERLSGAWDEPDSSLKSVLATMPWREWGKTAGRVATLGAAAACGFDLVLVALSHGVGDARHASGHSATVMQEAQAQAVAAPAPAQLPVPLPLPLPALAAAAPAVTAPATTPPVVEASDVAAEAVQVLAVGEIRAAPEVLMVAQLSSPAPLQAAQDLAPALANVTVMDAPRIAAVAAAPSPVRMAPIKLARVGAPFGRVAAPVKDVAATQGRDGRTVLAVKAAHAPVPWPAPRGWHPAAHGAPVVLAKFEPKLRAPHAVPAAAFDVPGWLAAEHVAAPRALVMSEPPHNLVHKADKAPATEAPQDEQKDVASAAPAPAPAPAPALARRSPPLVVASNAYGGQAPYYGGQSYRPYYGGYYGGYYGNPYGSPYGGYYQPSYGGGYYGGYGSGQQ